METKNEAGTQRLPILYNPQLPTFPDVSHYRVIRNEAEFARANAARVLAFKVNEDAFADKTAQRNIELCERLGLLQIGYEFDRDGAADSFLARFPPAPNRLPCLDAEATNLTLAEAETWCRSVERAYGRWPLIYGRVWFVGKPIGDTVLTGCPFWICEYGNKLFIPAGVQDVRAWQFTDGINGPFKAPRGFDGIGPCDVSSLLKPLLS